MTAILLAVYGVRRTSGRFPLTDARLTMSPPPAATIPGRNARDIR
jgi:hypothetical protein